MDFYGLSRILQFYEFVWALSYSVWDVFNKFLLIDATDRSKISSDQKRFFIALSLYPVSFFANTPFKQLVKLKEILLNVKWASSLALSILYYLYNKALCSYTYMSAIAGQTAGPKVVKKKF